MVEYNWNIPIRQDSMLIILTSPLAIAPQGNPFPDVVAALIQCKAKGHPVPSETDADV